MSASRRTPFLVLAWALATAPALAQTPGGLDPDETIVVLESSQIGSNCDRAVSEVGALSTSADSMTVTIRNPSLWPVAEGLALDLIIDGRRRLFWAPVTVPPRTTVVLGVHFPKTPSSRIVRSCGKPPTGIVESPDPVATPRISTTPDTE